MNDALPGPVFQPEEVSFTRLPRQALTLWRLASALRTTLSALALAGEQVPTTA